MFCPSCGTKNDGNVFKCVKCGTAIQPLPATNASKSNNKALIIVAVVIGAIFALICIIGILAAIAIPQFVKYRERAYDSQAYATIESACQSAQYYFLEYPEETITLTDLEELGVAMPYDVEITILDGTWENLTIQAMHLNGREVYITDPDCNIQVMDP
jgi:Tfp pilus assembly major pilin PilA